MSDNLENLENQPSESSNFEEQFRLLCASSPAGLTVYSGRFTHYNYSELPDGENPPLKLVIGVNLSNVAMVYPWNAAEGTNPNEFHMAFLMNSGQRIVIFDIDLTDAGQRGTAAHLLFGDLK